ncbi:MAG TPA: hypothetical protein VM709_06810, partial [Candidatus Sulfotelmatobacter sp.]|nr:hypothetical protein [Candidatus Sulfotelmatobacter sp.]
MNKAGKETTVSPLLHPISGPNGIFLAGNGRNGKPLPEQFGCQIWINFSLTSSFHGIYLDSCGTSFYTPVSFAGGHPKSWT